MMRWTVKPPYGSLLDTSDYFSRDLLGLWIMNEGAGSTIYDIGGLRHHGQLLGNVGWTASSVGPVLNFPGDSGDYVTTTLLQDLIDNEDNFTLMVHFWSADSSDDRHIMYIGESGGNGWGGEDEAHLSIADDGDIYATYTNTEGSDTAPPNETWNTVVGTFRQGEANLYVNGGFLDQHIAYTPTLTDGDVEALRFGRPGIDGRYFPGMISHAAVYKRMLSAVEIAQLYADPYRMVQPYVRRVHYVPGAAGAYTLEALSGDYTTTGATTGLLHGRKFTAGAGSYAITGTDASLLMGHVLSSGAGAYVLTGTSADLEYLQAATLDAGAGAYAITGSDAQLILGRVLSAGAGTIEITGTAAALLHGRILSSGAGAYLITGADADLAHLEVSTLDAGAGSYLLTGSDAQLLHSRILTAGAGSIDVTGTVAGLFVGRLLSAGAGSLAITGTDVDLLRGYLSSAGIGSYLITGTDADLTYESGVTVDVGAGAYAITGTDAQLIYGRQLTAGAGSIDIVGADLPLSYGRKITAGAGSYLTTGTSISILADRLITLGSGTIVLTGTAVTFDYSGYVLPVGVAAVTFTITTPGAAYFITTPGTTFSTR